MLLNLESVLDDIYEILPKQKEQDIFVVRSSSSKVLGDKNDRGFPSLPHLQQIYQRDHSLRIELAILNFTVEISIEKQIILIQSLMKWYELRLKQGWGMV